MNDSCTRILFLGIVIYIKTGYSHQFKDKEENGGVYSGFKPFNDQLFDGSLQESSISPLLSLRNQLPINDEEGFVRQSRAGYLFRTRKDPNKKDRMYLFRTKKDKSSHQEDPTFTSRLVDENTANENEEEEEDSQFDPRERRGGDGSNFYFRTRKLEGNRSPRGGYYFRTRKSDWMEEPSPISMRGYFLRTRKDHPGSSAAAYWFRNRREDEDNEEGNGGVSMAVEPPEKRGYFFRTRKLRDWDNFERNLRGRSYFLRT